MSARPPLPEVLHYVGYDRDGGGIVSVIRALASTGRFRCVLGVNRDFVPRRTPPLATYEFAPLRGETIDLRTLWQARGVARAAQSWLRADPTRVFHGHSRAGLLTTLWLARRGEGRALASVHCYGRQRWFYRRAARQLGNRLFWLSPAMKRHYGLGDASWAQCIPGCVPSIPPGGMRARGTKAGATRFAAIGALVPVKRWELLLEALALLDPAVRARLTFRHIGGEGSTAAAQRYAAQLRARSLAPGGEGTVQWLGEQPSADPLLADVDALVVVSHEEAFSVAMLEALRAGVPVLAPDAGGGKDLLTPEVTGWFFRHGEAADLARTLTRLIETDAFARVRITPEAIRPFTAEVVAEQWAGVYARLTSRD